METRIPNFIEISTLGYVMLLWDMMKGINLYFVQQPT
jgi:hypothetical protein